MSNDGVSPDDQAAIAEVARSIMRQFAAGQSAEEIARELCMNGWQKSTADGLVEHVQQDWRQIEAAPLANAAIYLQTKYPEMQPVRSPPTLQTVHGIGTGFYGSRDLDRATRTFVKTQCFCVMFVPVLALKSYRVASRGPGWTLMGRVPLSRFAKTWNILFLYGILVAIGLGILDDYLTGPAYLAGQKFSQAEQAAAAGKLLDAARLYAVVAHSRTEYAGKARQQCADLLERPEIDHLPLGEVTQIVDAALQSQVVGGNSLAVVSRGLAIVRSRAPTDPAASIALLGHIGRFSCAEACKTFSDLVQGPFAALPPAETVAVFRQAVAMPQSEEQKIGMVNVGTTQCLRLAATDLPAAVDLLAILAPLGNRPAVDGCLAGLLGKPLDKASCADVAKVVRGAKAFAGATGEKQLFQAGIEWVNRHPQAASPEVLTLLDQFDELRDADRARVAAIRRPLLEKLAVEKK